MFLPRKENEIGEENFAGHLILAEDNSMENVVGFRELVDRPGHMRPLAEVTQPINALK